MERVPDIDIICPTCKGKAAYYANGRHTYNGHVVPDRDGKAICIHCGHNAAFTLPATITSIRYLWGKGCFMP